MRTLIGLTVLMAVLPKVAIQCFKAWYRQQSITRFDQVVLGKDMKQLVVRQVLVSNRAIYNFDKWFHYLKGDFDLVGPEPIDMNAFKQLDADEKGRFNVSPGIISPYSVKKSAGIAYQNERQLAMQFVEDDSSLRRFGLLVSSWVQGLIGADAVKVSASDQFDLFGVTLSNTTMKQAINKIVSTLDSSTQPSTFAFVNADCANNYYVNDEYRAILNNFTDVFADGIGVKMAAQWQGVALQDNVNGTDMWPLLCEQLNTYKKRVFLLGASKKVVNKVASKLAKQYPNLVVAGYRDGFSLNEKPQELCAQINSAKADLLVVAMGAPRQEQWINDNIDLLNVKAVIGVGGLFDFYSETVSRAPEWLRELSLEWVWRLAVQPLDKGKRYLLGNPLFLMRVLFHSRSRTSETQTLGV